MILRIGFAKICGNEVITQWKSSSCFIANEIITFQSQFEKIHADIFRKILLNALVSRLILQKRLE